MDFKSFWSIWFWVVLVISWSISSHFVLGVPFDMIIQADRKGGEWARHCDSLIRANVFRIVSLFQQAGVFITGLTAFVIAAIGSFGFYVGLEFARALFILLVPHIIVAAFSVRLAFLLQADMPGEVALRKVIRRRRFWTQVTGLFAIAFAAAMPIVEYISSITRF